MDAMLSGGTKWAVERGYGSLPDLERIEERGQMLHAKPGNVSAQAKKRQRDEMGTLGSGNHYLEVQEVAAVFDEKAASAFDLHLGDIVVMTHCGSRGLGAFSSACHGAGRAMSRHQALRSFIAGMGALLLALAASRSASAQP